MMIETLNNSDVDFYLHVDQKCDITSEIIKKDNIFLLPDSKTFKWG